MAMIESSQRSTWRNADPAMLVTTLLLIGFGLLTIYSADDRDLSFHGAVFKQALFTLIGLGVMVAFAAFDYRYLRNLSVPFYVAGLVLLALVLKVGEIIYGAQRWFDLKITSFQPSEAAKLATIIALATFIAFRGPHMKGPLSFAATLGLVVAPAVLIYKEPDLGTALIFMAIWGGIIIITRTRMIYLVGCALASVPATWFAWNFLLHDYQRDRLLVFRHPEDHYEAGGYNIVQAKITIGQAGLFGHHFSDLAQFTDTQKLAVSTSDFAFAHAMGNFGFLGALALFTLYLLLIWRYLRVAQLARDDFGQLVAMGAVAVLFFQSFVNIGMNVNLLPPVGIPLPFISAGGTPIVTLLATQGILQSILMHRHKLAFGPG
jgi:rod shape determining protein RodA